MTKLLYVLRTVACLLGVAGIIICNRPGFCRAIVHADTSSTESAARVSSTRVPTESWLMVGLALDVESPQLGPADNVLGFSYMAGLSIDEYLALFKTHSFSASYATGDPGADYRYDYAHGRNMPTSAAYILLCSGRNCDDELSTTRSADLKRTRDVRNDTKLCNWTSSIGSLLLHSGARLGRNRPRSLREFSSSPIVRGNRILSSGVEHSSGMIEGTL